MRGAADIVRTFIEDSHDEFEEDYLFPRFERGGRLSDLTTVPRAQHVGVDISRPHTSSSRLEEFDRVAVGIVQLNLPAAGADLYRVPEMDACDCQPFVGETLAYCMHAGGHGMVPGDWAVFLDFLERQFGGTRSAR